MDFSRLKPITYQHNDTGLIYTQGPWMKHSPAANTNHQKLMMNKHGMKATDYPHNVFP